MTRLTTKNLPLMVNVPTRTRVTLSLQPYTPCMCGDYTGKHYQKTRDERVILTGIPTAKSLIGRMRWLARYIILSSTTPGIPILDHARADNEYPVYNVRGRELGLLQFLFGTTHPVQWKGVVTVQLTGEGLYGAYRNKESIVDIDYLEDKKDAQKNMVEANTRFKLLTLRSYEGLHPLDLEKILKEPLQLSLIFDENRLSRMRGVPACAKAFVTGLALTTPLILGLGKGATRGFGRFASRLDDDAELSKRCRLLGNLTSHLEALLEDGGRESIEGVFKALAGLAAQAAGRSEYGAPRIRAFMVEGRWSGVQIDPENSIMLSSRVKQVNRAIAAIGNAAMKAFWKKALGRSPDAPGSDIHTWILGLPRSQRFPRNRTCPMQTGYLLGVDIGGYKNIDESNWRRWKRQGARYQSPIIMFPLPPSGDRVRVVVLALPQCDVGDLLTGFQDSGGRMLYLYHAGVPGFRNYEGIPPCKLDVGRVEAILKGVQPSEVDKLLGYALPGGRRETLDSVGCDSIMGASRFFEDHVLDTIRRILEENSI